MNNFTILTYHSYINLEQHTVFQYQSSLDMNELITSRYKTQFNGPLMEPKLKQLACRNVAIRSHIYTGTWQSDPS